MQNQIEINQDMPRRRTLIKEWLSTKERYQRSLRNRGEFDEPRTSWFRQKRNFLPLLMIGVFTLLAFGVKVVVTVQQEQGAIEAEESASTSVAGGVESASGEEGGEDFMDYEEAKRIFSGG